MTCIVQDLSDEISHGAFAGIDKNRALGIAITVAESLQFLNEECQVMRGTLSCLQLRHHCFLCGSGDIKARNIVRLGSGQHTLIDFGELDPTLQSSY